MMGAAVYGKDRREIFFHSMVKKELPLEGKMKHSP